MGPDAPPADPMDAVQVEFDLRALADPRWREEIVELFTHMAQRLGVHYAQTTISRGWGYSGGSLWADGQTHTVPPLVQRNSWQGVPSYPVWLAWLPDGTFRRQGSGP